MVLKALLAVISASLLLILIPVVAQEGFYLPTPSNESFTVDPTENYEFICNDTAWGKFEIANQTGNVTVIPTTNDEREKFTCISVIKISEVPPDTFVRLTFAQGTSDVKVVFRDPFKERREVKVQSTQVWIFADSFELWWEYDNTTTEPLFFNYEPIPRVVEERWIYHDQNKTISLTDLGGFRPNTIRSFFIIGDKNKEDHSLNLLLDKLVLDEEAGDYLNIGIGSNSSRPSSSTIMFTNSITKPIKMLILAKDVFVSVSTIFSSRSDFQLHYEMSGRNVIKPTQPPVSTTAQSPAQLQALSLCFYEVKVEDWTCNKFMTDEYLLPFKRLVADLAQSYADGDQKIDLPTSGGIRADQVEVNCYYQNKSQTVEENFITVVITNPLDKEKPIFNNAQLKDFFKISHYDLYKMLDFNYKVMQCENYPNYWYWYWGSIAIFIFCVLLLMIMWYWSNQIMRRENNRKSKSNSLPYGEGGEKVNPAYEHTEDNEEFNGVLSHDQFNVNEKTHPYHDDFVGQYGVELRNKNRTTDGFREDSMISNVSERDGFQSQNLFNGQSIERINSLPLSRSSIQNECLPSTPVEKNEIILNETDPDDLYAEIKVVPAKTKPRGLSEISSEATNL